MGNPFPVPIKLWFNFDLRVLFSHSHFRHIRSSAVTCGRSQQYPVMTTNLFLTWVSYDWIWKFPISSIKQSIQTLFIQDLTAAGAEPKCFQSVEGKIAKYWVDGHLKILHVHVSQCKHESNETMCLVCDLCKLDWKRGLSAHMWNVLSHWWWENLVCSLMFDEKNRV